MNDQSKTPSIAELCAPISATVIPESQRYGPGGRVLDDRDALKIQRQQGHFQRKGTPKRKDNQ